MGGFEIVHVGVAAGVFVLVMAGDEVGKLGIEGDLAGFGQVEQGEFVYDVCEPLAFAFVGEVGAPEGVVDGFVAHGGLCCERHFGEVHDGGSGGEVFGEFVVQIEAHHCFTLHVVS